MVESTSFTGADLRKMRLRLKMSQAAFGTAIGVHENTIARYEQNPHLDLGKTVRLAIAAAIHDLKPWFGTLDGLMADQEEDDE